MSKAQLVITAVVLEGRGKSSARRGALGLRRFLVSGCATWSDPTQ
ncbi:MAG: hypothetical protein JWP83_980 [Mycobacterium sp.]|jgi:hypothetical protein|nr:hypothetical protein [Mycobacterium sp.]